jgi:hypothetical protein
MKAIISYGRPKRGSLKIHVKKENLIFTLNSMCRLEKLARWLLA